MCLLVQLQLPSVVAKLCNISPEVDLQLTDFFNKIPQMFDRKPTVVFARCKENSVCHTHMYVYKLLASM